MTKRVGFLRYWNKWVTVGGFFIATVLFTAVLIVLSVFSRSVINKPESNNPIVIIPASTYTPTQNSIYLAYTETPSAVQEGIQIGKYVQIIGTGGSGLRIRSAPGLSSPVNFFGMDSEVFLIQDGPRNQDGYVWWFLIAPYDDNRNGWAASAFLELVVEQP